MVFKINFFVQDVLKNVGSLKGHCSWPHKIVGKVISDLHPSLNGVAAKVTSFHKWICFYVFKINSIPFPHKIVKETTRLNNLVHIVWVQQYCCMQNSPFMREHTECAFHISPAAR